MQNTDVGFQSFAIALETRAAKQFFLKSGDTNNLRAKLYSVDVKRFKLFSASLLTLAPWYFDFPRLSLTISFFPDFGM